MAKGRKPPKPGTGGTNTIPQVTGLTASLTPDNKVFLQWNPVTNATTYWIRRIDPNGNEYVPAIITFTSYTDPSVLPSTTYTYSIAAVVGGQLGPRSSPVTITTN